MSEPLKVERDGPVLVLSFDRPERRNALTAQMEHDYLERLAEASVDPSIRAVVVTGTGGSFSSGADTEVFEAPPDWETSLPIILAATVAKPVIAAVDGPCIATGFVHALACDVRIADASARFSPNFSRIGMVAEHAASWLLPRICGHARALDLLLTGRTFDAQEALELGVVARVVEGGARGPAVAFAHELADRCSPFALAAIKRQVYADWAVELGNAYDDAVRRMDDAIVGRDFRQALRALARREAPEFVGWSEPAGW